MALEATHIRFAIDLKDKYQVKDIKSYIVGTVYPDSRYITGIDRALTHSEDFLDWNWENENDFKKGWLVHLLVDKFQKQIAKQELPQIFEGEVGQASEVWVKHTALKILQDLVDARAFDIRSYLRYLEYVENPNGEDIDMIKKYNQIIIKMYADSKKVNINSCYKMWKDFGIGDDLVAKIKIQAEQYFKDNKVLASIEEIYNKTLQKIKDL